MDKPKTVGIINLLVGLIFGIIPSIMVFSVAPKLTKLYQETQTPLPNSDFYNLILYLAVILCLISILWGLYLLIAQPKNKLAIKFGVVLAVVAGLTGLSGGATFGINFIYSIYSLTSHL